VGNGFKIGINADGLCTARETKLDPICPNKRTIAQNLHNAHFDCDSSSHMMSVFAHFDPLKTIPKTIKETQPWQHGRT
jgi:hypothetical protein